ncbi:GHKL domain-containing protein [Anaerovorax odorimutans]|uniref:GHKL domain-containing protein n=1 Tax=Anaerovorax odorimutans TaxID=109327 RepID=A0ABT1RRH6_9FIRM|nr:GHKL domain-containing protein [Anaerovorax odorimutans]MCQ4637799.1 GHKL domain-containing protein [Anaerovorax odorimutans]
MDGTIFNGIASLLEMLMLCGVLCILRRDYQKKGKIIITAVIMAVAATAADQLSIDINTGLNVFLITMIVFLCYRGRFLDVFFDTISSLMICQIFQLIVLFICNLISPSFLNHPMYIFSVLLLMTAVIYGVIKLVKLEALQLYYHRYKRVIWVVLLNFYIIQAAYMYNWNETNTVEESVFILVLLVIATNGFLAYNLLVSKRQEEIIQYHQKLFETKEAFIKQMAQKQHEFAKHIQLIHDLTESEDYEKTVEEIRRYTQELITERNENRSTLVYSGDSILSAFLMKKKETADKRNLQLSTIIKDPLPAMLCTQKELIEVVGNLLDNAMEAASDFVGAKRKIFFEIGEENEKSFLQTINYRPENSAIDQTQMMSRGYSTKEGTLRGYGLPNIRSIAEKYQGRLEIRMNDEVILIKVLFP